jgi:hypothetical protein
MHGLTRRGAGTRRGVAGMQPQPVAGSRVGMAAAAATAVCWRAYMPFLCVVAFLHECCQHGCILVAGCAGLALASFDASPGLHDFFKATSISTDRSGLVYVSTMEGRQVSAPCTTPCLMQRHCAGAIAPALAHACPRSCSALHLMCVMGDACLTPMCGYACAVPCDGHAVAPREERL